MLCRNNLGKVGKWGGSKLLFTVALMVFVFVPIASQSKILDSTQSTELKLDFDPISEINDITALVNNLINSILNGPRLNKNINTGTRIPYRDFSKFFSSSIISSDDILIFLKEAAVTGFNLTILVISITAQILKGLISVLK